MVLTPTVYTRTAATLLALAVALVAAPAPAVAADGEVKLPLGDYLLMVDQAAAVAKARASRLAQQLPARAEVVAQRTTFAVEAAEAMVDAELEVLVEGHADKPVELPFAGYPATVEVLADGRPAPSLTVTSAAVTAGATCGTVLLVAPAPGRYTVRLRGRAPIASSGGIGRLQLAAAAAPIAVDELDLPAGVAWSAPGSVVVEERVDGARRRLRLAGKRGETRAVELRRHVSATDAEKLLARAVVLTLFELRPEGTRRHDVVLYDVDRGAMASFQVELPAGLELGEVATDEGIAVPVVEGDRLTVHRRRQLAGTGYLVLSSNVAAADALPLQPPRPLSDVEVRARFLAVASSVAADVRPQPLASWSQVDLDDLPPLLREALQVVDLAAAWREVAPAAEARLAVSQLPAAARLAATVRRRDTTTLVTVDGTVLHRDRFVVAAGQGAANALEVTLPVGAVLWSARVGEQPVRPLQRPAAPGASAAGAGTSIAVPLGFENRPETVVEVVAVLERTIPAGRSRLALEAAEVALPVLDHRWRLLLPENARYRFRAGDLHPAWSERPQTAVTAVELENIPTSRDPWAILQKTPGVLTDRTNVGGNESAATSAYGPGGTAAVVGTILDERGGELPGVTVTLTAAAAPRPVVQVTNAQGSFRFVAMPPGVYVIKAELAGFALVEYPQLRLTSGHVTRVEVTMVAGVEDVITVTAESPLLDERRLSPGTTVSSAELAGGDARYFDFDSFTEARRQRRGAAANQAAEAYAAGALDLQQGLVGGVKPLNVAIPEAGKALLLAGVLPPQRVAVELEVKASK